MEHASASFAWQPEKVESSSRLLRTIARSTSATSSQSAGLSESVLRGKRYSFPQNRPEEKIAALLFLTEALRSDRDEVEGNKWPERRHGDAPSPGGVELARGALRDEAEIDIAVRARVAAGVGAEEDDLLDGQRGIHCLQAAAEHFALGGQRGGEVFEQQFHGEEGRQRAAVAQGRNRLRCGMG